MTTIALFAFNGEPMCFLHVLLNALDMKSRGFGVKLVLEGASVKLVPELYAPGGPLSGLWQKCLDAGMVEGVCEACSAKLGTQAAAKEHGYTDIYRQSLITLTEMQKLMGKKQFEEILGGLVIKPPGKPTLVPLSDKRQAMNVSDAKNEFNEIMED